MKRLNKSLLLSAIAAAGLITTSCQKEESRSNMYSTEVNVTTLDEITDQVYADSLLSYEEKLAFTNSLQSHYALHSDSLNGKTVGQLIDMQMVDRLERQKNSTKELAKRYILKNTVPAKLTRFQQITDQTGRDNNQLTFQVGNSSETPITKVSGLFKIYNNTNNTLIKQYTVDLSENIEPGKGLERNMVYLHDSTNNRDRFVRENLKTGVLRVEWTPDTVSWEDGKTIALER